VAVRWVARPPSALAARLGAGPVARDPRPVSFAQLYLL